MRNSLKTLMSSLLTDDWLLQLVQTTNARLPNKINIFITASMTWVFFLLLKYIPQATVFTIFNKPLCIPTYKYLCIV